MDKALNRFARLRYKDGATVTDKEEFSARKLSEGIGLSTGLISNLEDESIEDYKDGVPGTVPPCRASTLKLYHDYFGCSYEYLMGETAHRTPEHYNMGKDPILGLFDDSFIDNIKELLGNMEYQRFNLYMLQAFMSDPKALQYFMETVFYHLYSINKINNDSNIRKAEKDTQTAQLWFSLHTRMKEYFETCLMEKLDYGFRQHEQRLEEQRVQEEQRLQEQQEQWEKQAAKDSQLLEAFLKDNPDFDFEEFLKNNLDFDAPKYTITNITLTPVEEDNSDK